MQSKSPQFYVKEIGLITVKIQVVNLSIQSFYTKF